MLVVQIEELEVVVTHIFLAEALPRTIDELTVIARNLETLCVTIAANFDCFLLLVHICNSLSRLFLG